MKYPHRLVLNSMNYSFSKTHVYSCIFTIPGSLPQTWSKLFVYRYYMARLKSTAPRSRIFR